jgi:hypothetical protein
VKLQYIAPNTVTVVFEDPKFAIAEADLLSNTKVGRKRALKRVFSQRPLTKDEEQGWLDRAEAGPLAAVEYSELLEPLQNTPEHVVGALSAPQTLNADKLVPN